MTDRIRHAVSRSTGATTYTRKDGDQWRTTCLNLGAEATASARGEAWKNGSSPANFCAKCKAIAAGKADKITEGKLDLSLWRKKAPAKKAPAKKVTAPKSKTTAKNKGKGEVA